MRKLRKWLALLCVCTMIFSSMTVSAAQDTSALEDGTAYLNINNSDWSDFDAEWTNAKITGDGSYTVSMVASEGQALAQFNALEVVNGESYLGTGCVITIDAITINGEEVELQGDSYTCSADGGAVTTRVNLYNEWNAPDSTALVGDDNHYDCRVASGNVDDATAVLFSNDYVDSSSGSGFLVESMEVDFTVSGFGTQAETGSSAVVLVEGPAIAHLNINNADWSEFEAEFTDVEITGDGTYTVAMEAAEGQALAQFNALEVENGELIMGTACVLTIDSIKINGEDVELQGDSYTCSADGGAVTTRVNIYNEWNAPDSSAQTGDDKHLDCRVASGNVDDATAVLISSDYIDSSSGSGFLVESMEVTFTVSGFGTVAAAGEGATGLAADLDGVYHAYLGIQGPKYTFRDAFDNATTGYGTDFFDQVTYQGDTAEGTSVPATIYDTEIAGNGTYTVAITGIEWPEDEFSDQEFMNIIMLSTDIPNSGEITISDIVLTIDGSEINCSPLLNEESVNYMQYQLQSIYNPDIQSIGYYPVPYSTIVITFTVSGMNYDNPDATGALPFEDGAAAEEGAASEAVSGETEAEPTKSGIGTGGIIAIVVGVVAVAAVGVGVASKGKKKDEGESEAKSEEKGDDK
ncbi:MAG: hypothetical protein ACI4DW_05975 [Lachnospiraceae bacterium]